MFGQMSLTPEEWEDLVAKWRVSGMPRSRFAEKHRVAATALGYWIKRLPALDAAAKTSTHETAPVHAVRRAAPRAALARVVRPGEAPPGDRGDAVRVMVGKVVVLVEPGFDDVHLRAVVRALGELG